MIIKVMTRDTVEEEVAASSKKIAVISITDKGEGDVPFSSNENLLGVHRMKFNDEYESKHDGPQQSDFNGLRKFIDDISADAEEIIVHCGAGMSRSPAVAEAVFKYLEYKGDVTYKKPDHSCEPNELVLMFACSELGIDDPSQE